MRDIFILNEIWEQDKLYILVGILLGWFKYFTQYRYWFQTIAAHIIAG
jgi:hypothetical protein